VVSFKEQTLNRVKANCQDYDSNDNTLTLRAIIKRGTKLLVVRVKTSTPNLLTAIRVNFSKWFRLIISD